ncbi:uncharacterized protein LOC144454004 [Glandiceps talaboti]
MAKESQAIYEMGLTPGAGYVTGPEGLKAQEVAIETGKERCHRSIVNIVGKERQGKTSLRKSLTRQEFNPREESTVGIDHDLVDANSVNDAWEVITNDTSNEFEEAVGEHTLRILKPKRLSKVHQKAFQYAKCMLKILLITLTKMFLYYVGMRFGFSDAVPWFAILLMSIFGLSALAFGVRDGFGISIGIYALAVFSDAVIHWKMHESISYVSDSYGAMIALCASFFFGVMIDSFVGPSFGASLGTGMAISLCVMVPPTCIDADFEYLNVEGIYHVFLFMIGTLVGLGGHKEAGFHSYVIIPAIAIIHRNSADKKWLYSFLIGLGVGITHGYGLVIGRQLYVSVLGTLKAKLGKQSWRFFTYVAGIPPGYLLALICGWKWPGDKISHYIVAVSFVIMVELFHIFSTPPTATSKKERGASPCAIKSSHLIKASVLPRKRTKLTIRDFAGHPLYHFAHHIFMHSHSIYIIVFNLQEAVSDMAGTFKIILYWLHSIESHVEHQNASIFLVGTHRDSVTTADRNRIVSDITSRLPRKFYNIVVWNDSNNSPLFQIENSVERSVVDCDLQTLREEVWSRARNAEFMTKEWPIKYWAFLKEIRNQRESGNYVGNYHLFLEKSLENPMYKMKTEEEFVEMLNFFQNIGEIIYQANDDKLKEKIVFDPKFLVDVMAAIVNIPERSKQEYGFKDQWDELKQTGLGRESLIKHIVESILQSQSKSTQDETVKCAANSVLKLLQMNDLICPIPSIKKPSADDEDITTEHLSIGGVCTAVRSVYAVPKLLPKFNSEVHYSDWETKSEDTALYVDFGLFCPMSVFLRLLCQCIRYDHDFNPENGELDLNIFSDFGSFKFSEHVIYKLKLLSELNMFEIVIRSAPGYTAVPAINSMQDRLQRIVGRDFEQCQYTMGPKCPCQSPHEFKKGARNESAVHVLRLFTRTTDSGLGISEPMTCWCNGRRIELRDGKAYEEATLRRCRRSAGGIVSRSLTRDTHILNVQHDVYRLICNDLNVNQTLGKDWTGLAAVLGKTAREVHILSRESDPCDALLRDWGTDPNADIGSLLKLLELPEMSRRDIIAEIMHRM